MNPKLVEIVASALNGKRLEKFRASIKILNDSLAQGSWVKRGSVKADSGFYQGFLAHSYDHQGDPSSKTWHQENRLDRCLCFGRGAEPFNPSVYDAWKENAYYRLESDKRAKKLLLLPPSLVRAWVDLCLEKQKAFELLNDARPKPVLTAVLLSPKVTKTLKEMNLDIDLPSIKMPEIVVDRVETYKDDKGKEHTIKWYRIEWMKGIKHGMSRFSYGCQACGKPIPSGRFVPVEAKDKKSGNWVSFWLGCDCAKNIFGVKDIGIDKEKVVK